MEAATDQETPNRNEGAVVHIETGETEDAVAARLTGDSADTLDDQDEFIEAADGLGGDTLDGGALSGAVGGEKGAVAVSAAGEAVRANPAFQDDVEPNSPEAIEAAYESGDES